MVENWDMQSRDPFINRHQSYAMNVSDHSEQLLFYTFFSKTNTEKVLLVSIDFFPSLACHNPFVKVMTIDRSKTQLFSLLF